MALNYGGSEKALDLTRETLHYAKNGKFDKAIQTITTNMGMTHLYYGKHLDSEQIYLQRAEQLTKSNTKSNTERLLI